MKIVYTNANKESISISRTGTFRLLDIQGLGKVDAEVQTVKSPFQDGVSRIDTVLEPRYLTLEFGIFAETEAQVFAHRRTVSKIFNPKLPNGLLRCEFVNGVREIPATPEASVDFPTGNENSTGKFQRVLVNLVCPMPFWLSIQSQTKPMANWIGGLSFPLSFMGRSLKFAERGTRVFMNNDGDVSSPIQIVFHGQGKNPIITNRTTGEYIRVKRDILKNEQLVIDTSFGNKRVEIVHEDGSRTNVFNWLDLNSTFFQLVVGENEIEYGSDSDVALSTVEVKWRNRYLAI